MFYRCLLHLPYQSFLIRQSTISCSWTPLSSCLCLSRISNPPNRTSKAPLQRLTAWTPSNHHNCSSLSTRSIILIIIQMTARPSRLASSFIKRTDWSEISLLVSLSLVKITWTWSGRYWQYLLVLLMINDIDLCLTINGWKLRPLLTFHFKKDVFSIKGKRVIDSAMSQNKIIL